MTILSAAEWDQFLTRFPEAHVLQSAAWGELKAPFGWEPVRVVCGENGAQVLFRRLPLGLSLAYIPKGPVGADWGALWVEILAVCRQRRAILLKVEPDAWEDEVPALAKRLPGFRADGAPVQPRRTLAIDLTGPESAWLERMKQKTRYNVRLSERKEVEVLPGGDLDEFYDLMMATGERDGFGVHSRAYYRRAYQLFQPLGAAELFIARYQERALAGLMAFARGTRAWYFYGASNDEERNRMPTYLVQIAAMRWAAARGCTQYDLWGVPDADEAALEEQFERRSDGLWGVYRFKRGFGGRLLRAAPTYERALIPPLYWAYRWWARRRSLD